MRGRALEKSDANEDLKLSLSAELFCDDGVVVADNYRA